MSSCWLNLDEAAKLAGYETIAGVQSFIRRFNQRNPEKAIWRRWGKVEASTFEAALKIDAETRTPNLRATAGAGVQ